MRGMRSSPLSLTLSLLCVVVVGGLLGCPPPESPSLSPDAPSPTAEPDPGVGVDGGPGTPADCPPDGTLFQEVLDAPVLQAKCIVCHTDGGAAGSTRLRLMAGDDVATAAANMATVMALAPELDSNGLSILVSKPTLQHSSGHAGGEVVARSSVDARRLQYVADWARQVLPSCDVPQDLRQLDCSTTAARGMRQLRRLTRTEYLTTVDDLTGVVVDFVDLPLDQSERVFDSDAASLLVTDGLAAKWARAAEGVAERIDVNRVSPCGTNGNNECRDDFLKEFGARTFRRPLTSSETTLYREFFNEVQAQDGFEAAVRETVATFLQSPHFLYRAELGVRDADGEFALSGYEIATELSYLLVGTTPDDTLLRAAAEGDLDDATGRAVHIERLLQDARSEQAVVRFVEQWLDVVGFEAHAPADGDTRGVDKAQLLNSMRQGLEQEVLLALRGDTSLQVLLTRNEVYVDDNLATFYGVAAPAGGGFANTDGTYGGLLRNGAVLVGHSHTDIVAPILRGKLVRERLLCQEIPAPPANAAAMQEELVDDGDNGDAFDASNARLEETTCKSCHLLMDPIGHTFARYDAMGGRRPEASDAMWPVDGEVIEGGDASGTVVGVDGLAAQLADSQTVGTCFQQLWLEFGAGAHDAELRCGVQEQSVPGDLNLRDGLLHLTRVEHLVRRRGGADELDELDGPVAESLTLQLNGEQIGEPVAEPDPTPEPDASPDPSPEPGGLPSIPDVFDDGVTVTVFQNDGEDWGTGYCVHFRFELDAPLTDWSLPLDIDGTIFNAWNCQRDADSGRVTFTGDTNTSSLGAGVHPDVFGFCANR